MRMILPLFVSLFLSLFACRKTSTLETPLPGAGDSTAGSYNVNKTLLLQLVNNVRSKGCNCGTTHMPAVAPLTWNDDLAKAAYAHSLDMSAHAYFSHTGNDGSDPSQRIEAAGYDWTTWGENIANGYASEQAVVNGWLGSEGHCKNIMSASFKDMGAGRSGNYWTQDFGAR